MIRPFMLIAYAAIAVHTAGAQDWHSVYASRQLRDTSELHVHAMYAGGKLDIQGTTDPLLFSMMMRYSDAGSKPVHEYDSTNRSLIVGLPGQSISIAHHGNNSTAGEMDLKLSPHVPIDLDVDFGAASAQLDLGGLRLLQTRVHSGAAATTMTFGSPNLAHMSLLEIDAGAAELEITGLANANAATIRVNTGIGATDLTFDGTWTQDVALDVTADLGKVAVTVPRDVGVQVEAQRLMGGFEHPDLIKRGDVYVSSNWDTATFKLRVHANTVLGDIDIERIGAGGPEPTGPPHQR
jgi:hypothetical protein